MLLFAGILAYLFWSLRLSGKTYIVETETNSSESGFDYKENNQQSGSMALSPVDPNSYSRPDLVKTTHVHLEVEVDFKETVLSGHVILTFEKVDSGATSVVLDARSLTINKVTEESSGQVLEYEYGSPSGFGEKLEIQLPSSVGKEFKLRIDYVTSNKSSALQWLSPAQTAGKKHPYVFSQCQAWRNKTRRRRILTWAVFTNCIPPPSLISP